ncbi:contact-dependent growth inhibition system immunity protein [Variovorax sp. 1615]|uniref:contact-dependent growth inhibition system immunity protein n=1 Tax=Variovorax sp. UC122_21 TaxID=3374554 RepID=UPI001AE181FA
MRFELIDHLTKVYFGQDADILFGETGAEIMASYRESSTPAELAALRAEIADYRGSHDDLEAAFARDFERDYLPEDFGRTAAEFFDRVLAAVQ